MNLDHNQQFPNQLIDGDPQECVALSVADIAGNIDSQLYDPDEVYALCLKLLNEAPNTNGLDPFTGMLTAVAYGLLPISYEAFTAKVMGELYVANFRNYTPQEFTASLRWAKKGVVTLDSYSDICGWLLSQKTGVSLAMKWYQSFDTPNADGTLPAPSGTYSLHNVAVYDDVLQGLVIKPWLGPTFGAGGYAYLSQANFDLVVQGMWAFSPNAWRWLSLAQIAVTHPNVIGDILPQMTA